MNTEHLKEFPPPCLGTCEVLYTPSKGYSIVKRLTTMQMEGSPALSVTVRYEPYKVTCFYEVTRQSLFADQCLTNCNAHRTLFPACCVGMPSLRFVSSHSPPSTSSAVSLLFIGSWSCKHQLRAP